MDWVPTISPQAGPLYRQIAAALEGAIVSGQLRRRQNLPNPRAMEKAVARQLARVLEERGLRASGANGGEKFWTSGDPSSSQRVISALLGREVSVEKLPTS
jgi:glutamate racemase